MIAAWVLSDSALYPWVILPVLIFMARVADVTLGTIRLVFVTRGYKYLAPLIGFAEVLIWILVMGQIMRNLSNVACYVAFSGGFATGNFVGMWLAEKLIKGNVMIRVVTQQQADHLIEALRKDDYGVTSVDGQGVQGPVKVIFTIIPRHKTSHVIKIIRQFNPKAFYTVEEVGQVGEGVFPARMPHTSGSFIRPWLPFRKGK